MDSLRPAIRDSFPKQSAAACRSLLMAFLATLCLLSAYGGQHGPVPEYRVKAAFLYNFAKFVDWPETAFDGPDTPLVLGVLDPVPFDTALEQVRGKTARGRQLTIRTCRTLEDAQQCHILFLNTGGARLVARILGGLEGKPILTVSEAGRPDASRAMIRFFSERNRLQFSINPELAARHGLQVSSRLLKLATITDGGEAP